MGIGFTGTWIQLAAQTLLVYRLTGSGTALGLLTAIQFVPTLVLGAWAGVVVDRYDKRRIMTIASTVMAITATVLAALVVTDRVTLGAVYVLAACFGLANTFDNPARRTLVERPGAARRGRQRRRPNSTLITTARIVGPAIAGALIVTVGIGWCFALNALSFVPVILGLRRMDSSTFRSVRVARAKGQLREGLRYAMSVDDLRVPLALMAVVGTLSFNFVVLLPLLAERDLGGSDVSYTVLTSFFGVGSLIGSLPDGPPRGHRPALPGRVRPPARRGVGRPRLRPGIPVAAAILVVAGYAGIGVLSGGNAVLPGGDERRDAGSGAGPLHGGVPGIDADRRPDRRLDGRALRHRRRDPAGRGGRRGRRRGGPGLRAPRGAFARPCRSLVASQVALGADAIRPRTRDRHATRRTRR